MQGIDAKSRAVTHHMVYLLSNSGIVRITPLPVPIHKRLDAINRQMIRTKEKPRLPVPDKPDYTATASYKLLHLACYSATNTHSKADV